MKALITGAAGFIGSHLSEALVARGDEVLGLDDLSTGSLDNIRHLLAHPRFVFRQGTVVDPLVVREAVLGVDVVFHLAAAVGVHRILNSPIASYMATVRGTEVVLEAAAQRGCRLLFASTSEVYGKNDQVPLTEQDDHVLGPTTVARWLYARAKAVDESLALAYSREAGAQVIIARFFNTIGPGQTGLYGMVVPRFVGQALKGEPLSVHGSGKQTRCFTYVADTVAASIALSECPAALGQVVNVGRPSQISIEELAQRVIQLIGSRSQIRYVPYAEAYGEGYEDMQRRVPDISKLRRLVGFEPQVGLDEALQRIIAYARQAGASVRSP